MPSDSFDYRQYAILPDETWPQYLRRIFPEVADAMYDRHTTPRDYEFFRLGTRMAFAEETYARQTFRSPRTPEQIVDEFLRRLDHKGDAGGLE